ncbi:MAG: heavy metal translocating P-type ATPase [Mogibacterium sp.]|nr:heavy metal translocating P-type ATPase [Mogibacterium sp.]
MKFKILHQSPRQLRIHILQTSAMTMEQADLLETALKRTEGVSDAKVFDRTGNAIIRFSGSRDSIIEAVGGWSWASISDAEVDHGGRVISREYQNKLTGMILRWTFKRLFFPAPLRHAIAVMNSLHYIREGLFSLKDGKLNVSVLDATAITLSMLRGDFGTASSVMFLLRAGELLEEWTQKKSIHDLAQTMSLNVERVWLIGADGKELLIPIEDVNVGEKIVVRMGGLIPLDGKVLSGEAAVNQASMTGESLPVVKKEGSYVYAGTVVEDGEIIIQVDKTLGTGKYDRIVKMIEESEKLKSTAEYKATTLADKLVPYSLGSALAIYLLTRNVTKAMSVVMVDFSCAIKLATPIAVLSAMREGSQYGMTIKGGRFLEVISKADTIVFDKTGTLTHAVPSVAKIVTFGDADETESLRLAACLEEHYPHSVANAIVKEASDRGIFHEERHGKVDYVVAHGISSTINGMHAVIGSRHFVFEDEKCKVPRGEKKKLDQLDPAYSHIYLALEGVLQAVLCIHDPLRAEAADVVSRLHRAGFSQIVMMTGDNEKTAHAIAGKVGIDRYFAEVLPEDKARFIKEQKAAGHTVMMVGDGVNDSPALSEADVGIAISNGAAIAREIADITISANDLYPLLTLKDLANRLMRRIDGTHRGIIGFNLGLIILGVAGILPPATSALFHNASTIATGLYCMTDLLPEETK